MHRWKRSIADTSAEGLQYRQPPTGSADPQQRPAWSQGQYFEFESDRLQMNGANSPVMIEDGKGFHYILMPLRVK